MGRLSSITARPLFTSAAYIEESSFEITETAFRFTLFLEFMIKFMADGFVFTGNGYLCSIWNALNFLTMVNINTGLVFIGGLSRFT